MRIAICLHGDPTGIDVEQVKKELQDKTQKFGYVPDFFTYFGEGLEFFDTLYEVAMLKREKEIDERFEYAVCLAFEVNQDISDFTFRKHGRLDKVFYMRGEFSVHDWNTLVNPRIFYSNSFLFDRACEFKLDLPLMKTERIRGFDTQVNKLDLLFYYHLKSVGISCECNNYENSSMFQCST